MGQREVGVIEASHRAIFERKKKGKRKKESMSSGWKNEREKKERKIMNKEDIRGLDRLKIKRQSMQKFEESH